MPSGIISRWAVQLRTGNWKFMAFALTLVLLFLAATWLALNRERQTAESQAVINSANLARAAEEQVVATVRSVDQILQNIARDYKRNPDAFDFQYWVRNCEVILDPASMGLGIADEKGIVTLNNAGPTGYSVSDGNYFLAQRDHTANGLVISVPLTARGTGRSTIQFSRRLERADGSFAGVVAFGVDTNYFSDFYQSILVGDRGSIALIGLDGVIRARLVGSDRAVGQSVHDAELFERLSNAPAGSYHVVYNTDQIERIASFRRLRDYPLIVVIGFSVDEVLGPYKKFRQEVLTGALLISGLTLTIAIAFNREIGRRQDSERLLEGVVEAAPATIQLKDTELRIRWTNRAFLAFFGPFSASPIGKRVTEAINDGPDMQNAERADWEVVRTGRGVANLAQAFPATGDRSESYMLVTKTPIFGADGNVSHILTIGTDITALRKAQAEAATAREAERSAEAARSEVGRLLSGMPTAVYHGTIAADGRLALRFVSDNVATITGRSAEDIAGPAGWYDYIGQESAPEIEAFFARLSRLGESQTEYRLPGPGGIWIRDRARVASRCGDCLEIIGNWTDITREQAIAQKAMENAKLATLGELATGLAHELNQPIAVMSLAAENAEDALADGAIGISDARVRLSRIIQQAQRAKKIISHLQIFGRNDSGPMESVRLEDAVAGALALVNGHLRDHGIVVKTQLPRDLPPITGRLVLIENVLVNLCVNARDAMRALPADRRILRIEASALPRGRVELRVIDQGGGIPAHVMPRLFEPFFTTKSPGDGTGLGLSVSHGMMQAMDGDLSVTNTGTGACFVLSMRVAIPRGTAGLESSASDALAFVDPAG